MQKSILKNKKGQLNFLRGIAIGIGLLVVIVVVIAQMIQNVQSTQATGTAGFNISRQGLESLSTFGSNFGTIVLVAVLAGIIFLFSLFGGGRKGSL
jgi:hypothetical protein